MVFFNLLLLGGVRVGPHHVDAHLPELFPDFVFFSGGRDAIVGGAYRRSTESLLDPVFQPVIKVHHVIVPS